MQAVSPGVPSCAISASKIRVVTGVPLVVNSRRILRIPGWLAALVCAAFCMLPPAGAQSAVLIGSVHDAAGKPVANASMTLTKASESTPRTTHTDGTGAFEYGSLPPGSYSLRAEKAGLQTRTVSAIALAAGEHRQINLRLAASSAGEAMSFSDDPNFTVAGVTDWTAVGGHGSDSILRTSEDLARETLALKARQPDAKPVTASEA